MGRGEGSSFARFGALSLALTFGGCGGSDTAPTPRHDAGAACVAGQIERDGGGCDPAGVPSDLPCPPGQLADSSGACVGAGVVPAKCAQGFTADDAGGCTPVLPASVCAKGAMAVPGEAQCHDVAPCGSAPWGSIPVDATTQYVDAAYATTDSDGSAARPWKTIADAIAAAEPNAIVAIAAGTYAEDVQIADKPVRLWGRCPAMVAIEGTATTLRSVLVQKGGDGTEIHAVGVSGPGIGIASSGSADVLVDHVWVHDTGKPGIFASDDVGATKLTVASSLVESAQDIGLRAKGADVTVDASVVRGSKLAASGLFGVGVDAENDTTTGRRATFSIKGSLVEANHETGIGVTTSDATIDATVVRSTAIDGDGKFGDGIVVEAGGKATITGCVLDANHDSGIWVTQAEATIEATVARGTLPLPTHVFGWGIDAEWGSTVTVRASLVEGNTQGGVVVTGSNATLEGVAVRNTQPIGETAGVGVEVRPSIDPIQRAMVSLSGCAIEQNHESGIHIGGSDATIETTAVRATQPNTVGWYGRGMDVDIDADSGERANVTLRSSLIEDSGEMGIAVVGCDITVDTSTIRATHKNADGNFGDGLAIVANGGPATLTSTAALFDSNERAGLSSFGAAVTFGSDVFSCNQFDLEGEDYAGASFSFDHQGGNVCGCAPTTGECQVLSSGLAPPSALAPIPSHN